MKIDVHGHFYPEEYVAELENMTDTLQFTKVSDGRTIMKDQEGNVLGTIKKLTIEDRITDMDKMGIDMQILSLQNPNVYFADDETNKYLAKISNNSVSEICKKYPDRFLGFASVPLGNVNDAVNELDRAINVLKMNGLALGTNVRGKPLDSKEFIPFFEKVNDLKLPIALHPMPPMFINTVREYGLVPVLGFVLETTIVVARLIFSGTLERFNEMNFILSHLGGALPYLAGRLNFGYNELAECRQNISSPPSESLKRVYYDTAQSFHKPTMRCAFETVGIDHLVLGSDYPHSSKAPISIIEGLFPSLKDREKIYHENIIRLLKNSPFYATKKPPRCRRR